MKAFIRKVKTFENITGLLYIVFYFSYIGVNMYHNKGNYISNAILLILTCVYLLLYIYSVFIEKNRAIKRKSKHIFVRARKFVGFVNACMILASVVSNEKNSITTVLLAVLTVVWFFIYSIIDISSSIAMHDFKKYGKELGWKYDNRN